ncbi:MAG: hypothetical protein SFW07_07105, partial [Gammaproteobacteria bacterium]|nr:hypothetical protein [Gammaproteobacteria bacterium]
MNKISVQSLNSIFDVIEDLSSTVGWVRDITGKKQLYVSRNYEKIWEHPVEELYEHPSSFNEWLITDGNPSRKKNSAGLNLYRVRKSHDKVLFVKDQHYLLTNDQGIPVGHVGFATEVSQAEWEKSLATLETTPVVASVQKNVLAAVQQELKIYSGIADAEDKSLKIFELIEQYISMHALKITPREKACL